jgi:hypothetical protein
LASSSRPDATDRERVRLMKLSRYLDSVPPPSVGPRETIILGTVGKADLAGGETHQVQVHAGSNY